MIAFTALLTAACSSEPADEVSETDRSEIEDSSTPAMVPGLQPRSDLKLEPLGAEDASAVSGELACAFMRGEDVLLLAKGVVGSDQPNSGAIRFDGSTVPLTTPTANGFDAMVEGAVFAGQDVTAGVRIGNERDTGNESSSWDATLAVSAVGAEQITIEGQWSCGP